MRSVVPINQNDLDSFPIYLNVYDLTTYNDCMYWFGVGIYHSGIEAHGVEYAYGAHDYPTSGVFQVEPRHTPGFVFRNSIYMGNTNLNPSQFREFVIKSSVNYTGDSYHLVGKNCNHFTSEMCRRLIGTDIPGWINRLAYLGWFFNCLLPEALRIDDVTVRNTPEYHHMTSGLDKMHGDFMNSSEDESDSVHLIQSNGGNSSSNSIPQNYRNARFG